MVVPFIIFQRFRYALRKNFAKLALLVVGVVVYGTISEYFLERNAPGTGVKSMFDSLWFVMQTITTVGYGDTPVVSFWGRINAIFLMLVGIGVLGFFTATFATRLIEYSTMRRMGGQRVRLKNHILVCNWNPLADTLFHELLLEKPEVVLLAQLETSPLEGPEFVKGTCLHLADLERADVRNAESVIILSEMLREDDLASGVDAKAILGIMNTRKLNPDVHVIAELLRADSGENARMAGADEVVVRGEVSAKLLSRGALDPGTIDIMQTILSAKSGEEIFEDPLPQWAIGKRYVEVARFLLDRNGTSIALRGAGGLKVNPSASTTVDHDSIIYIARERIPLKQ